MKKKHNYREWVVEYNWKDSLECTEDIWMIYSTLKNFQTKKEALSYINSGYILGDKKKYRAALYERIKP